ncbi:hypothetical protein BDF21DRAFT_402079 [Thamnidium elegans]|nr:hypothetical protein BDF21DRAFT_402079 [Thamnidium elegans]
MKRSTLERETMLYLLPKHCLPSVNDFTFIASMEILSVKKTKKKERKRKKKNRKDTERIECPCFIKYGRSPTGKIMIKACSDGHNHPIPKRVSTYVLYRRQSDELMKTIRENWLCLLLILYRSHHAEVSKISLERILPISNTSLKEALMEFCRIYLNLFVIWKNQLKLTLEDNSVDNLDNNNVYNEYGERVFDPIEGVFTEQNLIN